MIHLSTGGLAEVLFFIFEHLRNLRTSKMSSATSRLSAWDLRLPE
jgi:hypothetical protein